MVKIELKRGSISEFEGDAIIVPSDVDLTYEKANGALRTVIERGGQGLLTELSSIGRCEIGNAVITQGYELNVDRVILIPYQDINYKGDKLTLLLLHKALKAAFNLASSYGVRTLAIEILPLRTKKMNLLERLLAKVSSFDTTELLSADEIMDVIAGVAEEHKKTLEEIVIYK